MYYCTNVWIIYCVNDSKIIKEAKYRIKNKIISISKYNNLAMLSLLHVAMSLCNIIIMFEFRIVKIEY